MFCTIRWMENYNSDPDKSAKIEDLTRRLSDAMQKSNLSDTDELRLDLAWLRTRRRQCEAMRAWSVARIGDAAKWALWVILIGVITAMTAGGRQMLRQWIGLE